MRFLFLSLVFTVCFSSASQALELITKFTPSQVASSHSLKPTLMGHGSSLMIIHDLRNTLLLYVYRVEQGSLKLEADLSIHLSDEQIKSCDFSHADLAFDKYAVACEDEVLLFKRDTNSIWNMQSIVLPLKHKVSEVKVLKSSFVIKSMPKGLLIYDEAEGRFAEVKKDYQRIQRWGENEILALQTDKGNGSLSILTKDSFKNEWSEKQILTSVGLQNLKTRQFLFQAEKPYLVLGIPEGNNFDVLSFRIDQANAHAFAKLTLNVPTYVGSTQMMISGEKLFISQPYHTSNPTYRWTGMIEEFALNQAAGSLKSVARFEPGMFSRTEATLGQSLAVSGGYLFAATQSYLAPTNQQIKAPAEIFVLKP